MGVLGIFVGVVFVFFESVAIVGDISTLLSKGVPLYKVLVAFVVVGIVLLNVLAILMYFVGRLSGKSISASCSAKSCRECEERDGVCKKRIKRVWKKHYPIIILNGFLILLLVLSFGLAPHIERWVNETYYSAEQVTEQVTEAEPIESTYEFVSDITTE